MLSGGIRRREISRGRMRGLGVEMQWDELFGVVIGESESDRRYMLGVCVVFSQY